MSNGTLAEVRPGVTDEENPSPDPTPPAETGGPPDTVIRPPKGWHPVNVRDLWRYRELLFFLVWRDVKVRYKQTALGVAWAVLQPLLMMAVFTVFFGRLAGLPSGDVPYPLFAFAGLLPWTFFSTALASAGNSVVTNERLITKVYFPRLAVPFAAVGAAAVDFAIAGGLLLVLMLGYGVAPGWSILFAPVVFLFLAVGAVGFGTLLAALNVKYRDFRYVIPFLVQFWMFATPTVYMQPPADADDALHTLLNLNPLTGLVAAFRAACLGSPIPWAQFGLSAVAVVVVFVAGCLYFRKAEDEFADVI
ncbi:MAG TPA: ABC transporter permease [Gemmataceae bacterium]|nr:ABC transporter permease [Gemmataceae bacterium]